MRRRLCLAVLTQLSVLLPWPAGAQGYDPRNNPNYRPPPPQVSVDPRASPEQLMQQGEALVDQHQYAAAMPLLLKAARAGNARAQAMLGIIYQDGDGLTEDDHAAAYWFGLAAAQGHRAAQYELGAMYEDGAGGLPKDERKAVELYMRSARQGFSQAQLVLGVDFELGDGVPRNRPQAIALLRQAGGDGAFMAQVLAQPRTPARFADAAALGNYLARIRNSQFAASWAKATAPYRHGGREVTLGAILYGKWRASGGGGEPTGPPPTH
ncbi:MAG TPA: tetratricopeptide repeat protein [Steroidobacteraceae bacterium]|nr:tetratricopeptide repeat protein [Steroidobacteraceae bacterium]